MGHGMEANVRIIRIYVLRFLYYYRFENSFNEGITNYSHLTKTYWGARDIEENKAGGIAYEQDITIYNITR